MVVHRSLVDSDDLHFTSIIVNLAVVLQMLVFNDSKFPFSSEISLIPAEHTAGSGLRFFSAVLLLVLLFVFLYTQPRNFLFSDFKTHGFSILEKSLATCESFRAAQNTTLLCSEHEFAWSNSASFFGFEIAPSASIPLSVTKLRRHIKICKRCSYM